MELRTKWARLAEWSRAMDSKDAVLMADGSVRTRDGELLVELWGSAEIGERRTRYEAWCRRAARAVHTTSTARQRTDQPATSTTISRTAYVHTGST